MKDDRVDLQHIRDIGDAADVGVMADIVNATTGQRMWTFRRNPA